MIAHEITRNDCRTLVCYDFDYFFERGWTLTGRRVFVHSAKQLFEMVKQLEKWERDYMTFTGDQPFPSDRCSPDDPNDLSMWLYEETVS